MNRRSLTVFTLAGTLLWAGIGRAFADPFRVFIDHEDGTEEEAFFTVDAQGHWQQVTPSESLKQSIELGSPQQAQDFPETRSIAALMVNYQNDRSEPFTKEQVQEAMFTTVSDLYKEYSYGKLNYVGDVYGWITLPVDAPDNYAVLFNEAVAEARRQGVPIDTYSTIFLIITRTPHLPNGLAAGHLAMANGTISTGVIAHELGHTLGLGHASVLNCSPDVLRVPINTCERIEYGDVYDVMGGAGRLHHFNAARKEWLGWIPAPEITTVTEDGIYTIHPFEAPESPTKELKIPSFLDGREVTYTLEYRQNSRIGDPRVRNGVLIHLHTGSILLDTYPLTPDSAIDAGLPVGESYTTPDGIKISPLSNNAQGIQVKIELGPKPSVIQFNPSTLSVREQDGAAVATVTRALGTTGEVSVHYKSQNFNATEGSDFIGVEGDITFADGDVEPKTITVPILDDPIWEPKDLFRIALTNPSPGAVLGPASSLSVYIDDDDSDNIQFDKEEYTVYENIGQAQILIKRHYMGNYPLSVQYTTRDGAAKNGTDYVMTKGTVTFQSGETAKIIEIPIIDNDSPLAAPRDFLVDLFPSGLPIPIDPTPTGPEDGDWGNPSLSTTVLIRDDDGILNQPPDVDVGRDQTITLPSSANLSGSVVDDGLPGPPAAVTVAWSQVYGPGTVTFGNPDLKETTASFSEPGPYTLRLTASDGELSASDDMMITVNPAPPNRDVNGDSDAGSGVLRNFINPIAGEDFKVKLDNLAEPMRVSTMIYDRFGVTVKSVEEDKSPGDNVVRWNGHNESGEVVASGVYNVKIRYGSTELKTKVVVKKSR